MWSKSESMPVKLQNNIVILIRAHPQTTGCSRDLPGRLGTTKVHDLALDRATGRVRSEAAHTNNDLVCLTVQDAFVRETDTSHDAIDRADNAEWHGGNIAPGIAKHQDEVGKQNYQWNRIIHTGVLPRNANSNRGDHKKGDAFPGDKWITSAFQTDSCLFA